MLRQTPAQVLTWYYSLPFIQYDYNANYGEIAFTAHYDKRGKRSVIGEITSMGDTGIFVLSVDLFSEAIEGKDSYIQVDYDRDMLSILDYPFEIIGSSHYHLPLYIFLRLIK